MPQVLAVIAAVVVASSLLLPPVRGGRRGVRRDGGRRLRDELAAVGGRGRLLRRRRGRPAAGPLLVAGRGGAVLRRLAAAAARRGLAGTPGHARAPRPARRPAGRRRRRVVRARPGPGRRGARAGVLLGRDPRLGARGAAGCSPWRCWSAGSARGRRGPRRGPARGAIVAATLLLDAGAAMPGAPALLPVLGAVALLAAGTSAAAPLPTRALSARPARFVGRISYAWYVWHWPVLVFAATALGPLAVTEGLAVTLASLVPALAHAPLDRGAAAALEGAPAPAAGDPGRRDRRAGRRRRVRRRALGQPRVAARRCPRARRRAPASSRAPGASRSRRTALRPRPVDATRTAARPTTTAASSPSAARTSPRCVYGARRAPADRRAVRRLARDAAVPGARARRTAPPLATGEPDQGGLPAVDACPSSRRCRAGATRSATRGASTHCAGSSARSARRSCWPPAPRTTRCSTARGGSGPAPGSARSRTAGARCCAGCAPPPDHVVVAADPPRATFDVPACVSEHLARAAPLRVRPRPPRRRTRGP